METKGITKLLNDYNCKHWKFPVIVGVTEPRYGAEELAALEAAETVKHEWNGRWYTLYELTQVRNRYGRKIAEISREAAVYAALGDREKEENAKIRLAGILEPFKMIGQLIADLLAGLFKPKSKKGEDEGSFFDLKKDEPLAPLNPVSEPEKKNDEEPNVYANPTDKFGLTETEKNSNAEYIYLYLRNQGWSKEAICGLLGNIQRECQLNPGAWEISNNPANGYGIVQWTPYPPGTPNPFLNWAGKTVDEINTLTENDAKELMNMQLEYLLLSCTSSSTQNVVFGWYPSMGVNTYNSPYKMSFDEFINSNNNAGELAAVFNGHYERSSDAYNGDNTLRVQYANEWYKYFQNW